MLKTWLTLAWRNLIKSKWYSFINTLGLSIGMAVALIIGLWIWDEVSFDRYHANYDQIAQVMGSIDFNGDIRTAPATAAPLARELENRYSKDIKAVALTDWNDAHILAAGDKMLTEHGLYAEPDFTEIFTLKMLSGNKDALKDPSSILLSQSMARALFGNDNPINRTVKIDNKAGLKVAGVFEDWPRNTNFYETKYLIGWGQYLLQNDWVKRAAGEWGNHSFAAYVQLQPNVDLVSFNQKIKGIAQSRNNINKELCFLQPMKNWHLRSDFKDGKVTGGRIQFVWLFGIIGVFVLLLACINFMNLSTARSEKRAREVGIRKTVGSLRGQLIGQFLSESAVVALLAFALGLFWVELSLPYFNDLSDKDMHLPLTRPLFWLLTVSFTVLTGLLAGSYPAFYLSSFNPIKVLKGSFRAGRYASLPRKVLVVVQFTVSITLITGTILVFRQVNYARNRPVGYAREGMITMDINTPELREHYETLRQALLAAGAIVDMAESSSPTTGINNNLIGFDWKGKDPNFVPIFGVIAVSVDYGKTIGWSITEGRDFSRNFATDSGSFILNESAARLTGLQHPVGETIKWNKQNFTVAGVVKDMVIESPYEPIKPMIFFTRYKNWANVIDIRLNPALSTTAALATIGPVFKQFNPGSGFEYKFVDDLYASKFSDEQRIGDLASVFAVLAIFISCLGLFGLASFVAEQRTREIGVRKVLGASLFRLWKLQSAEFILLVLISCLISTPIAWYFLDQWLLQYEYHAPISLWAFVFASLGALGITLLTVSYQAIRAAGMNPTKSLRTE